MTRSTGHAFSSHGGLPQADQLRMLLDELQASKAEIRRLEALCTASDQQARDLLREHESLMAQLRHWQQQASTWREACRQKERELEMTSRQLQVVAHERDHLLQAREQPQAQSAGVQTVANRQAMRPKLKKAKRTQSSWATILRSFLG